MSALSYHFFTVNSLSSEIIELQETNKNLNINYKNSQIELKEQSEKLLSLSADYKQKIKELSDWKNKEPKVRYEKIYSIREVKSDDCEDIKNTIDDVRTIDYGEL
jgi:hypothetical protein